MLAVLHGFTETDECWRDVFPGIAVPLRRLLLPGHGWTPCPRDLDVASCAADLARRLPEDGCDLLGYSMGGRVALRLALDHPERVRRLILVSSNAGLEDPAARAERRRRDDCLADILEEDGIGPFVAWWETHPVLRPVRPVARSEVELLRSRRLNQDPLGLAACLRGLGQGAMEPLWDRLGELRMPVLLVAGEHDTRYAADLRRMAAAIPAAELEVLPGTGHAIHREWPERLREVVLAFLAATADRGGAEPVGERR